MFFMINPIDIASDANDNTPYSKGKNRKNVNVNYKQNYKGHQLNFLNSSMKMA